MQLTWFHSKRRSLLYQEVRPLYNKNDSGAVKTTPESGTRTDNARKKQYDSQD